MAEITININDVVKSDNVKTFSNKTMSYTQNSITVHSSGVIGYQGYVIQCSTAPTSPVDGATYYWGTLQTTTSTTSNSSYMIVPRSGAIKRIDVIIVNAGTLGSAEASTMSFRLNDATDTTISSIISTNSAIQQFTNSALSISVAAGDTFEIKWAAPTYATNPTNLRFSNVIYIE